MQFSGSVSGGLAYIALAAPTFKMRYGVLAQVPHAAS
jgi:hypothetical protein